MELDGWNGAEEQGGDEGEKPWLEYIVWGKIYFQ